MALCAASWLLGCGITVRGQQSAPVVLDRVVAVVNNHAILLSDVHDELRLSVLEPEATSGESPTARAALDRLISRTMIQQQIREEDAHAAEPSNDEVLARVQQLRKLLPACVHMNCASDTGWNAFLTAHGITAAEVQSYMRMRLEILGFIENRFRQGIRIAPSEIEDYYKKTLIPQYPKGETPPSLDSVAPRIEEILLQQQVTALFVAWLENLRKQGDVEVLDPAFLSASSPSTASAGGIH